jgi:hypothetical protein
MTLSPALLGFFHVYGRTDRVQQELRRTAIAPKERMLTQTTQATQAGKSETRA